MEYWGQDTCVVRGEGKKRKRNWKKQFWSVLSKQNYENIKDAVFVLILVYMIHVPWNVVFWVAETRPCFLCRAFQSSYKRSQADTLSGNPEWSFHCHGRQGM